MIKPTFDTLLDPSSFVQAQHILEQAREHQVSRIINVGTSLIESKNCITLAQQFEDIWASIGIHPNDCTPTWKNDVKEFKKLLKEKKKKLKNLRDLPIFCSTLISGL